MLVKLKGTAKMAGKIIFNKIFWHTSQQVWDTSENIWDIH